MELVVDQEPGAGSARIHEPVMGTEVCAMLSAHAPAVIVDATVGTGGHAEMLLAATGARLVALDRDEGALAVAAERLRRFGSRVILRHADFAEIDAALEACGVGEVDAILADLGMSSFALDDPARGFSFRLEGPLDMRTDLTEPVRAYDLVNEESEEELARIIREYGEDRAARRVARAIVKARQRRPLETTRELAEVIERAVGGRRAGSGLHPATRTFQALRIAVNHELESLSTLLERAPARLRPQGRMAVIAYHSLEDRPVKECFRALVASGEFIAVTGKVMRPNVAEVARNPRARSARLRCIERGRLA